MALGSSLERREAEVVDAAESMSAARPRASHYTAAILLAAFAWLPALAAVAGEAECEPCDGRSTAVALNYCRASFHRILRYPSKRILLEEQERILNNLNLNGIADEEVVRLYTAVLLEIGEVRIADRERQVIGEGSKRALRRQLTLNALTIGAQVATAQCQDLVRSGCNSWWDYRGMLWNRELDLWKVDKARILAVTDKSSLFLDTFWKLARRRNIVDRWLIRGEDLDRLDAALLEPNAEVRLRVMQRMGPFMECYPPYWYYLGRTQQALGQWPAAAATFGRLAELGDGHFRRDEMLAAGLANRALIQDLLGEAGSAESALRALGYATGAWEVNLLCGRLLEKHGRLAEAEDAILRNLDVDLEQDQSRVALLSLYSRAGDRRRLAARLNDVATVEAVPLPVLAECAAVLGGSLPRGLAERFSKSAAADFDLRFGDDDLVIRLALSWQIQTAFVSLAAGGRQFTLPSVTVEQTQAEIRFRKIGDVGGPLSPVADPPAASLMLQYPGVRPLRLHLVPADRVQKTSIEEELLAPLLGAGSLYRLAAIDVGDVRLPLDGSAAVTRSTPIKSAPEVPAALSAPMVELLPEIETEPFVSPPPPALPDELPALWESS